VVDRRTVLMADTRRRFNAREKQALWLAAGGRCESCGDELQRGWHADHIQPWSREGETDVINGAALCASCNLTKGGTVTDPRSKWQANAVDAFIRQRGDFLVTACPGAGKTLMALKAARELKEANEIDQIVVVVPTNPVRRQWSEAAATIGVDLTANYQNHHGAIPRDADGVVATYAQVAANPQVWRILSARDGRRTLVILDEIHHCQDEDNSSWGPALVTAFNACVRRLLLSGTPFRTDGARIPFVEYDSFGRAVSHGGLTYRQAVRLGVVRPVRFEVMDGEAHWLRGSLRASASASSVERADRSALMTSLYVAHGLWMRSILKAADEELTRTREEMPTAAGLIVAADTETADQYAEMIAQVTGEVAVVVHSKLDGADEAIRAFRAGRSRWVVAVDMISEGVDIPRLAVIVYASMKMTEMWFRQIVGRAVRRDADELTATVFIPAVSELVAMAANIEGEAEAGLADAVETIQRQVDDEQMSFDIGLFVQPVSSSEAVLDRVLTPGGDTVSDVELERAAVVRDRVGGSIRAVHLADLALVLREATVVPTQTVTLSVPERRSSGDELRAALRRQINSAVAKYARESGTPHSHVHSDLNATFGDTVPTATVETLQKRLGMVQSWL